MKNIKKGKMEIIKERTGLGDGQKIYLNLDIKMAS